MASIMRNIALRPVLRQSTIVKPNKLSSFALQRQSPLKIAAFHNSARKAAFLPVPPQTIDGTINKPAPVPTPHPLHGSYHWDFERFLSVGLVPLTLAPFIGGSLSPILDSVFCAFMLLHSHIGFQACIIDYFPHSRVPTFHNFLMWTLRVATLLTGWGLYEFETNDIGVTAALKKVWNA